MLNNKINAAIEVKFVCFLVISIQLPTLVQLSGG